MLGGLQGTSLPVPHGIADPPAIWIYNIAIPAAGIVVFGLFSYQSWRRKQLTWWWLFFVSGALCWWLETFGDWGQYLVYSPKLWHYHLPIQHASPDNPLFMPWAYGLYWGVHAILVLRLAEMLSRRTGWKRGWSIVVLAPVVGYIWDIVVEGMATHFGWWSYETPLGPYFDAGRGLQPLVVPIVIMFTWPNLVAWLGGDPADRGPNYIERMFRIDRIRARLTTGQPATATAPAGTPTAGSLSTATLVLPSATAELSRFAWKLELARLAAWVLVFQVTFAVLLDVPLIVLRLAIGHPSSYIP